jgi:hypothetical protein
MRLSAHFSFVRSPIFPLSHVDWSSGLEYSMRRIHDLNRTGVSKLLQDEFVSRFIDPAR